MKRAVLADAGPLFAAVDPSDKLHKRAVQELKDFARNNVAIIVPSSAVLETYTLVLRKLGAGVAHRWLNEVSSGTLLNPSTEDYHQAFLKVVTFPDQKITLFDAVVAILATRLGTPVWTYDHHFDVMRVPVWR